MKTRFIAAALMLISLWGLSAPLVLAATTKQTAASRMHACCPGGHTAFSLPMFVSPGPATMPCGDQHPCCAKQAPAKPALLALNQENRAALEYARLSASDGAPNNRTGAAITSASLSPCLFLRSTVLRI